jgi:hypothetical protein
MGPANGLPLADIGYEDSSPDNMSKIRLRLIQGFLNYFYAAPGLSICITCRNNLSIRPDRCCPGDSNMRADTNRPAIADDGLPRRAARNILPA